MASLMLTLGLATVPFHPTPSFWENEGHSSQDEVMRWLRAGTKHLCSQTLGWGGGGGRQVCGLGIVGAAAPPCPSSGALRTSASSIFPSHWSEGGEGESNSLTGLSMAAAKGPRSVGGENLATGGGRRHTAPFVVLDYEERHHRLGRNKPRASQGSSHPTWGSRPPYPVFV